VNSRLTKIDDYFHVRVIAENGAEDWLLTESDITRIRERGRTKAPLVPAFTPPSGLKAALLRWAGVL